MTLTEFLLARLDEDRIDCDGTGEYSACAMQSERYEAFVGATRRIVTMHADFFKGDRLDDDDDPEDLPPICTTCHGDPYYEPQSWPCPTLRALAVVYADHSDYDPTWRSSDTDPA